MDRFYRNLLQQKMSKLDALREAQLWMLNTPESAQGSIVRGKIVRLKNPAKRRNTPKRRTDRPAILGRLHALRRLEIEDD